MKVKERSWSYLSKMDLKVFNWSEHLTFLLLPDSMTIP